MLNLARTAEAEGELDAESNGSADGIPPPPPAGERDGDGDGELDAESNGSADGMPPPPAGEMDCKVSKRDRKGKSDNGGRESSSFALRPACMPAMEPCA